MPYDVYFIGPLNSGLQNNVKPWLVLDDAFSELTNAYNWRLSVKKRPGARVMNESESEIQQPLFSRLRQIIGTTNGAGALGPVAVPTAAAGILPGMLFSCGDEYYTVDTAPIAATLSTGAGAGTVGAGTFTLVGGPIATDVYFYPAYPVMALLTYETTNVSDERLIAFDTTFAYEFTFATGWLRLPTGTSTWNSTNADFFTGESYRGITPNTIFLFVTNNLVVDALRYLDGATNTWVAYGTVGTTQTNAAGDFIETCRVMKQFKNSMLFMNVAENVGAVSTRYINRIRYSASNVDITSGTAWRQDITNAGFITIPVEEAIIASETIKDRLIVYCENSTWEVVFTNNSITPFIVRQINTELGVESTNSLIPFDKEVLGFGNVGIHACNGVNVARIDEGIPREIFEVSNADNGPRRVNGIRDYYNELVYWSYQSIGNQTTFNTVFPNKVLLFNYINRTWAFLDDSITAFGNYQYTLSLTWDDIDTSWDQLELRWEDATISNRFRSVIAGNQEGYTFIIDANKMSNSVSLQITQIAVVSNTATITCYNHNLEDGSPVMISGIIDNGNIGTELNDTIFIVTTTGTNTFTVSATVVLAGTYNGGGNVTRVSSILIRTKMFNFYNKPGMEIAVEHVDLLVDNVKGRTGEEDFVPAQIGVDISISSAAIVTFNDMVATNSVTSVPIIECSPFAAVPYEQFQQRFWRRMYYNVTGETIQIVFSWDRVQVVNPQIVFNDFQLNAMIFYVRPTKRFG